MEDPDRSTIVEFCHLLEKSRQLFNGLRDLPQYGHIHWHGHFRRAFDVYTKLWKFQQKHRSTLDTNYGLKRWQIGEIASKIGQLYYHFYLRTSDTGYLVEACAFYEAIRGRCYYTKVADEGNVDLVIKKLRYYARFIVVALLLKKMFLVNELVIELDWQINEYGNNYNPNDKYEWILVVKEVKAFMVAECVVTIYADPNSNRVTRRLPDVHDLISLRSYERTAAMTLTLHDALIVGCCDGQVKFSELTIDMYRILLTVEHNRDIQQYQRPDLPNVCRAYCGRGPRDNPHKYLLFKPTHSQLYVYLSSAIKELPTNGVMLIYISADGYFPPNNQGTDPYDTGGVVMYAKNRDIPEQEKRNNDPVFPIHILYPGDMIPFTRRPLFLIIDSDNSLAFRQIPRLFGQPMVIFMSPVDLPYPFKDQQQHGNIFTLFMHSPLAAFCYISEVFTMDLDQWKCCHSYIDQFMVQATRIILSSKIDSTYIKFFGDEFLRALTLRYVFCEIVTRCHRAFRSRNHRPSCEPPLPEAELLENSALMGIIYDLACYLNRQSTYLDPISALNNGATQTHQSTSRPPVVQQQPTTSQSVHPKDSVYKEAKETVRHGQAD